MDYQKYLDKIYGCYLGVSIGGLIGAPFEGAKEIIDVNIDLSCVKNMLFNDDLDLQVLFFQAVERYGLRFNANQLAELFFTRCPYAPGEYAFFKKNYARGILPPVSGTFNNEFYSEGMGCCIRGELWGCLFPANPKTAKQYAYFDGCQDHSDESVYSEYFIASVISYGFILSDIHEIIDRAKEQIPSDSKFRKMLDTVCRWCAGCDDIDVIRERIIHQFGHPDCTNVFQNLGFIVAALKLYFEDFETLLRKAIRCGFDTDCTGGIVAAVWGTVHGGAALKAKYNISEVKLVLGVDCPDYDQKVYSFAQAVAEQGVCLNKQLPSGMEFSNAPKQQKQYKQIVLYDLVEYDPVLRFGEKKTVKIRADVPCGQKGSFSYKNDFLKVLSLDCEEEKENVYLLTLTVILEKSSQIPVNVCGKLLFKDENGKVQAESSIPLGFAPPSVTEIFGPFFDTYEHLAFETDKSYYPYFSSEKNESLRFDNIRNYHLNYKLSDAPIEDFAKKLSLGEEYASKICEIYRDKLHTDALTGYQGPCVLYVRKSLVFPEEKCCMLWCGCEGAAEVWLNGEKLAENGNVTFFTYENFHVNKAHFRKGINYLVYKIDRVFGKECFSCNILNEGGVMDFPDPYLDYSEILKKE